jgi:hypothetical protein
MGDFLLRVRKAQQTSVRIAGTPVEIQTKNLLNQNEERYGYATPIT